MKLSRLKTACRMSGGTLRLYLGSLPNAGESRLSPAGTSMRAITSRRSTEDNSLLKARTTSANIGWTAFISVAERAVKDTVEQSYHADIAAVVSDLALDAETDWAVKLVQAWLSEPVRQAHWLAKCAFRTRQFILPSNRELSFGRAVSLEARIIQAAAVGIAQLNPVPPATASEADKEIARVFYNLVNEAVTRLYFALDPKHPRDDQPKSTEAESREFYFATKPILDAVVAFGHQPAGGAMLGPTAHYFMQLLNVAVGYDTKGVLAYAAAIATASKPYGYNLDHLAVKEVVELVETILADHRIEVQDEAAFNNLLTLLDAFTEVGWPSALALVWRLDEIYR